jgi:hypothetical protein
VPGTVRVNGAWHGSRVQAAAAAAEEGRVKTIVALLVPTVLRALDAKRALTR